MSMMCCLEKTEFNNAESDFFKNKKEGVPLFGTLLLYKEVSEVKKNGT